MNKWNYAVIKEFNKKYYSNLLTRADIISTRIPIKFKTPEGDVTRIFYVLKKDLIEYALPEENINDLPLIVTNTEKKVYARKVYDIITGYQSAKFTEKKVFTFKELVDNFLTFNHTNPDDFLLWKLIGFAALLSRVNVRVATNAGFGKDSVMKVLGDLFNNVVVVNNATVAKIEYRLNNKVILANEVVDLNSQEKRAFEQILLSCGDFSNTYEKRSRSTIDTNETYDISNLSLIIAYNTLDHYPSPKAYFDFLFQKAVSNRFFPIKLSGRIDHRFASSLDAEKVAQENDGFFKGFIRSVIYYENHWREEVGNVPVTAYDLGFKDRWAITLNEIINFIKLYSEDDKKVFKKLLLKLIKAHEDYERMITPEAPLNHYGVNYEVRIDRLLKGEEVVVNPDASLTVKKPLIKNDDLVVEEEKIITSPLDKVKAAFEFVKELSYADQITKLAEITGLTSDEVYEVIKEHKDTVFFLKDGKLIME